MAEKTVAELIALTKSAGAKAAQARSSWIKPNPVYPTTERRVTTDSQAGHTALDLAAPLNSPIKAVYPGIVERVIVNDRRGYGNLVIIKQPDGTRAYYAHLNKFGVREGQSVRAGQAIGLAGSTGNSSGSHLHLEFRTPSGTPINPHKYFGTDFRSSEFAGPGGRAEYGASEMIGRAVDLIGRGPALNPFRSLDRAITGIPSSARPGESIYREAPLVIGKKEEGELTILKTPIGDVNVPDFPWLQIAAVGGGLMLVLISVISLLGPQIQKVGKKAIPLVAGAVNPAAGVVAGLAT